MRRCERGLSASVEAVLIMPVLLGLILGIVQLGVFWHARNAAVAAAQTTAELNRRLGGDTDVGAGYRITERAGLTRTQISVNRGSATVRVTVTAAAPVILPFPGVRDIAETVVMPVERVTRP